jgi:hypothetical protein
MNANNLKAAPSDGWFVWDEFYTDLDFMAEDYVQDLDRNMSFEECIDILPNKAYAATREYMKVLSTDKLINKIAQSQGLCSGYYDFGDYAQEIWETAIDDLWFGCDTEFSEDPNSIDELQAAIDRFVVKNQKVFRLFGRLKSFTPIMLSRGGKELEQALKDFEEDNKHFWLYVQSADFIELDAEFWKFWIAQKT